MSRKARIAIGGALTLALLIAAALGGAYYAARQVRPFYRQALAIEPEILQRGSRELESRATALYSDARQQGEWQALFTAEQINGWLAMQLAANEGGELPTNIRDPRVAITKDALTLGFSTTSGGVDTVVTVDANVSLTDEGAVAIHLMSVRAGALPLPVMRLADEIASACEKLSLPVRWAQQAGEPIALVELHTDPDSNKPQLHIDSIELGDSELYVAGHTNLVSSNRQQAADTPAAHPHTPTNQFKLDEYELRLTPTKKDGALQIARRGQSTEDDEAASE